LKSQATAIAATCAMAASGDTAGDDAFTWFASMNP